MRQPARPHEFFQAKHAKLDQAIAATINTTQSHNNDFEKGDIDGVRVTMAKDYVTETFMPSRDGPRFKDENQSAVYETASLQLLQAWRWRTKTYA